jgi:hypothetical protein
LTTTLWKNRIGFQIEGVLFTLQMNGMYFTDKSESPNDIISEWIDKPVIDWSLMPAWAKFVAMDNGGKWFLHTTQPLFFDDYGYWEPKLDGIANLIPAEYAPKWDGDWKESLIERP